VSELLPRTAADIVNSKQRECKYSYLPICIRYRARIGGFASLSPSEVQRKCSLMHCMPESGPERQSLLDGRVPNQDDGSLRPVIVDTRPQRPIGKEPCTRSLPEAMC